MLSCFLKMKNMKLVFVALTILACHSMLGDCQDCKSLSGLSSQISGYFYNNCWKIEVPVNNFIQLKTLSNETWYCDYVYAKIEVPQTGEEHDFCNFPIYENPVIAFHDVIITLRIKYGNSLFLNMEYKIEDNECLNNNSFRCSDHKCIPEFQVCDEVEDCENGTDEIGCEDIECLNNNSFRCSNYKCIPESEVCDGVKNCENGIDEIGCETGIKAIKAVIAARISALSWLKSIRTPSWGWKENTYRAVVALQLASGANFNGTDLEEELMAKETELKISVALLRTSLSNNQLSMFLNSLLVTCHNPRSFYGNNLVKRLKEQVEQTQNFTHPVAYLSLCNANETWPLKASNDLDNILSSESDYPFVRDIQAMAVIALSCEKNLIKQHNSFTFTLYQDAIRRFKGFQQEDGSFGNVYTTALIAQALLSSGEEESGDWDLKATIMYLIKHLNSSSIDFLSTYLTLPLLNGETLSDIAKINCSQNHKKHGDDIVSQIKDYVGPKMRVQYSLFIGDDKEIIHTISVLVPMNYTAYEVMELGEVGNPKYKFERNIVSQKVYVYGIANVTNDPEVGKFWLLYLSHTDRKNSFQHLTTSPDKLVLQDGEHLIMWYKTASI